MFHHELSISPGKKEQSCTMGKTAMPYTVLPRSALGAALLVRAVPSAPSRMPLEIPAFEEPLTQIVPSKKPATWHRASIQLTTLSCNYTQPLMELGGKSVYLSPSNRRREDSRFLTEMTLLDVPIHITGCRTKFLIKQLGILVFYFSYIPQLM